MYYSSNNQNDYWYFFILAPILFCVCLSVCCVPKAHVPVPVPVPEPTPETCTVVIESPGSEISVGIFKNFIR